MIDMLNMMNTALVERHNVLAALLERNPLRNWKGKKSVLIDRIKAMDVEVANMVFPEEDEKPARTIRSAAVELLCHVDHYEDRDKPSGPDNVVAGDYKGARSVGLPYDRIIALVKEEFSAVKCETTVACLRWYAVKIRVEEHGYEGLRLPQRRPRVKSRKG